MPDTFWTQTPRHFQLAMQGVRKRLDAEADARAALAYESGAFAGLAYHGKLKAFAHYQRGGNEQSPEAMLAMLKAMGGTSNMTIRKVPRSKEAGTQ